MEDKETEKLRLKAQENKAQRSPRSRRNDLGESKRPSRANRTTVGQSEPCKECGAIEWDTDESRGEVVCGACGLVVEEDIIDPGAEWVNHGDVVDRSRVGAPSSMTLADKGLNTNIDRSDLIGGRASRHGIRGSKNIRDWRRRATIDQRSKTRSSRSRNLTKAMQFIRASDLPESLQQRAGFLYRKAADKGIVTGRSIRGVSAACVYLTAREEGLPRTIEEIAERYDMLDEQRLKELKRTIRLCSRELNVHHITGPQEYLDKFHSDLGVPPEVLAEANYLWSRVGGAMDWQGKKPSGVAGVLLYKASQNRGHSRTQAEVCKVSGVSEVTLRGLLRLLEGLLSQIGEAPSN